MNISDKQIMRIIKRPNNLAWANRHYLDLDMYRKFEVRKTKDSYHIDVIIFDFGRSLTIRIDLNDNFDIEETSCNCFYGRDEVCGHIIAVLLLFKKLKIKTFPFKLSEMIKDIDSYNMKNYLQNIEGEVDVDTLKQDLLYLEEKTALNFGKRITHTINNINKETFKGQIDKDEYQLFFEVLNINDYQNEIKARIKIGKDKLYIVKNIMNLLQDFADGNIKRYGTKLEFKHDIRNLDDFSKKELTLIKNIFFQTIHMRSHSTKELTLNRYLDDYFDLFYQGGEQYTNLKLKEDKLFFELIYKKQNNKYKIEGLYIQDDDSIFYGDQYLYSFDGFVLTRLDVGNQEAFLILNDTVLDNNVLFEENDFYDFVEQIKATFKDSLIIDLPEKKTNKVNVDIYADIVEDNIVIELIDNNDAAIVKNIMSDDFKGDLSSNAKIVKELLEDYHQQHYKKTSPFIFPLSNDATIELVESFIPSLTKNYKVLIGESLKKFNPTKKVNFNVGVRINNNLLELDIKSEDIDTSEIAHILKSYKKKKKFYKLKSGEVISLDREELGDINDMLEGLSIKDKQLENDDIKLPIYEAFKLEGTYFEQADIEYQKEESYAKLINDFKEYQGIDIKIKDKYLTILKEYQKTGVDWLLNLNKYGFGGILADDMGLGKTIQAIAYLESMQKENEQSIVICPASLLLNWQDELDKFDSDLKYLCVYGSAAERKEQIANIKDYDLIITTYDYLKKDIDLYEKTNFSNIILDEAQYIKNHATKAAKEVRKLKGRIKIALTGTPIENSLAELWSIFDFLMPGYLYNYNYFKKNYETPIIKNSDKDKETSLKKMVEPFILRRRKQEVLKELPDKIEKNIPVQFYDDEEKLYMVKLSEVNKDLKQILHSGEKNKLLILKLLLELRQICCEPRLLYENIKTPSSKMDACMEIVSNIIDSEQSVLIFSSFTTVLELLEIELKKKDIKYLKLTGENSKTERKNMVDTFQNYDIPVFLISLKAGGTGLNLTKAQAVIHYDPWWNLSAQNQATDRVHRIGQENKVEVFNLIMKNSIEEKIIKLQEKKKNISDMFVEDSGGSISKMNTSDIINLLKREDE